MRQLSVRRQFLNSKIYKNGFRTGSVRKISFCDWRRGTELISQVVINLSFLRKLVLGFLWVELEKLTKIVKPILWWWKEVFVFKKKLIFTYFGLADTPVSKIEECFTKFLKRDDIYVILINQHIAEMIRHLIESHTAPLPAVVEMPSKGIPYDSNKDSIMKRARVIYKITLKTCFILFFPEKVQS